MSLTTLGLPNLGATCYANAIVQCWMALPTFRDLMVRLGDPLGLVAFEKQQQQQPNDRAYHHLLSTLQRVVAPMRVNDHNDAHEFMQLVITWLHEKYVWKNGYPTSAHPTSAHPTSARPTSASTGHAVAYDRYMARNESWVSRTCFSVLFTDVRCGRCAHTTTNFEHASEIRLTIQDDTKSLDDALRDLFLPSTLADWVCDRCGEAHPETKRTTNLWSSPPILVLLVDKMRFDCEGGKRIDRRVDIPRRLKVRAASRAHGSDNAVYELRSVCEHHGSITHGHYTANVAQDGEWLQIDDTVVTRGVPPSPKNAYILFFEARDKLRFNK